MSWLGGVRGGGSAGAVIALVLLAAPAVAVAQPGQVAPVAPVAPTAPAPAPAPDRSSVHHREGVYISIEFGGGIATVEHREEAVGRLGTNRTGLVTFAFTAGGTLGHTVLGGTALMVATSKMEDATGQSDQGMAMIIGPSIDWFSSRTGGVQIGGMLGFGPGDVPFVARGTSATSLGGGLWIGYAWWVGDEWSIGARAQLVGATATTTNLNTLIGAEHERSARFATWGLAATATFH